MALKFFANGWSSIDVSWKKEKQTNKNVVNAFLNSDKDDKTMWNV